VGQEDILNLERGIKWKEMGNDGKKWGMMERNGE